MTSLHREPVYRSHGTLQTNSQENTSGATALKRCFSEPLLQRVVQLAMFGS